MKSLAVGLLLLLLAAPAVGEESKPAQNADWKSELDRSLAEFKNRKIYDSIDAKVLAEIPDDKVEQAIIDYVALKVGDDWEREFAIVSRLPSGIRAVHATWWVEAEVNNGGFNQYFWNSSGQFAKEAVAGFRSMGAPDHEALMQEAIRVEAAERETMSKFKARGTIEAFSESYEVSALGELDRRFLELPDLSPIRVRFIRRHPELFEAK